MKQSDTVKLVHPKGDDLNGQDNFEPNFLSQPAPVSSLPAVFNVEILREPPIIPYPKHVLHTCSAECLNENSRIASISGARFQTDYISIEQTSPYCVPLYLGWARQKRSPGEQPLSSGKASKNESSENSHLSPRIM